MALTNAYANFDLGTGSNDGTSEANAWQTWAAMRDGYAANDHVYVKQTSSRHDAGSTMTHTTNPGAATPVVFEGYKTTPGDGGDSGETNYFQHSNQVVFAYGSYVKYFDAEGSPPNDEFLYAPTGTGSGSTLYRCRVANTNASSTVPTIDLDDEGFLIGCTIVAPPGESAVDINDSGVCYGCRIDMTGTGSNGVEIEHDSLRYQYVVNNMILGNGTGKAIFSPSETAGLGKYRLIYGNSIYNVAQGVELAGVDSAASNTNDLIMGNVIYACATGIGNLGAATAACQVLWNAVGGASTARYAGFGDNITTIGDVTLTANPFNDPDNWDFRINSTDGGGAAIAGIYLPDPILDGSDINVQHYGAVQAQVVAAVGSRRILTS